jgi:hypothetical protein
MVKNLPEYIRRLLTDSLWSVNYISRVLGVVIEFSIILKVFTKLEINVLTSLKKKHRCLIVAFQIWRFKCIMKYMKCMCSL